MSNIEEEKEELAALYFKLDMKYRKKLDFICKVTYLTKTGFIKSKIDEEFYRLKGETTCQI